MFEKCSIRASRVVASGDPSFDDRHGLWGYSELAILYFGVPGFGFWNAQHSVRVPRLAEVHETGTLLCAGWWPPGVTWVWLKIKEPGLRGF